MPPFLVLENSGHGQDGCAEAAAPSRSQLRVVLVGVVMARRKGARGAIGGLQRCGVRQAEKSPGVRRKVAEGRGCRWYLGTDRVAAYAPGGGRDVELGQGCSSCCQGLCERELVAPVAPAGLRLCSEVASGAVCGGSQGSRTSEPRSRLAAGVFVLNLVCRDARLKESVLAVLREVFPLLYARRIDGEVNEILFCQPSPAGRRDPTELGARARVLEGALQQPGRPWDSSYVLADMLQAVTII